MMDVFDRLKALQADLENLGCRVEMHVSVGIYRIDVYNPKHTVKPTRLTEAQRAMIRRLRRDELLTMGVNQKSRTLDALVKRGLVAERYQPPLPGNDYGGRLQYSLTAAGRAVTI